MAERLQPYLPNFDPRESAPYRGSEHLVVEKFHNDYYVYLTPEGVKRACTKRDMGGIPTISSYPIETHVISEKGEQELIELRSTREPSILQHPNCHDGVMLFRDRKGPVVLVYTALLGKLLRGELPYVVTRYDLQSNKIWIRMAEPVKQLVA